ncbi:MAG: ATP-binding protein [Candidatus Goldbacteria bacterium]|nr:ATP-binding protein [Candidatus Goldiibacteriota bacterium]
MENIYLKRDIEKAFKQIITEFPAVTVTGPRQAGKTTLIKHILGKDYDYVTLDDFSARRLAQTDPGMFLDTFFKGKLIIDEAQYAPDLFPQIKMKIDENPREKGRFIITGSQKFLLAEKFTETLAGRVGILSMETLSLSEISAFTGIKNGQELFENACLRGTYPQVYAENISSLQRWYDTYIQTYLERDVKTLYNVGDITAFSAFYKILSYRCGQILNLSAIAADIGAAVSTIKKWVSILEAGGLIYLLYPYHANTRTRLTKSPKVYFMDNGMVCRLNNITDKKTLNTSPLLGYLFENYCISEAVKKVRNTGARETFFFYRTAKGAEVDLVIEKEGKFTLCEFKSGMRFEPGMLDGIKDARAKIGAFSGAQAYVVNSSEDNNNINPATGIIGIRKFLEMR